MSVSVSALRADLYNLIDQVIETGQPLLVRRKGHTVRIVVDGGSWLDRLEPWELIAGDPEELVNVDVSGGWTGGSDLDEP